MDTVGQSMNFNIGVLGHVDSGKTSLVKSLSTIASTACFDKNPQSKERGITLDLGFSSFVVNIPEHLLADNDNYSVLQYTLVDCPGHASLIKTIIGGAQIIDLMMLVIDITKGMQTQTAECLIIGEILCSNMIVILNKVDLISDSKRQATIEKMTKRMLKTLENTRFAGSTIVPVSAKIGGADNDTDNSIGIDQLIETIKQQTFKPARDPNGSFLYAVDHCFSIKGQGTIMTGTVLSGNVSVNDMVEIPSLKVTKKVKSMQMFKKPVNKAHQGDRVGICVTQFDPKLLERGLVCSPESIPTLVAAIVSIKKISYYKNPILTKSKFHITIGHETVMGNVTIFGSDLSHSKETGNFDFNLEYLYQDELNSDIGCDGKNNSQNDNTNNIIKKEQFALIELEKSISCSPDSLVIGSKFDTDIHSNTCRLAFHGKILKAVIDSNYKESILPNLKVYKDKLKEGIVERKSDEYSIICKGLFKKETKIDFFTGMKVTLNTGELGLIEGSFGQSGKFKVRIPSGLSKESSQILAEKGKKNKGKDKENACEQSQHNDVQQIILTLAFKRYIYDPQKKMKQT